MCAGNAVMASGFLNATFNPAFFTCKYIAHATFIWLRSHYWHDVEQEEANFSSENGEVGRVHGVPLFRQFAYLVQVSRFGIVTCKA